MFHLSLPPRVWQRDLPALVRAGRRGVAELTRFDSAEVTDLIAGDLKAIPTSERGAQFGNYDQLVLVQLQPQLEAMSARQLLAEFSPGHSQLIVALMLGIERSAGQWSAQVWKYGTYHELQGFRLVGPGMRSIELARPILQTDADYWSRTRGALGTNVFQRVRNSRVALVGCSRNGSVAAHAFAMLGVEKLILIDPDREELHNLAATLGSTPDGVGDWKVHNRAAALRRLRPDDLSIETLNRPFPDRLVEDRLHEVDLICTCVDQDLPRLAAAVWANRRCRLHLDIGSGVFHGLRTEPSNGETNRVMGADVRLCLPGEACVACLGGLQDINEAQHLLRSPPGVLPRARRREWHEARAGSLPTVNSVAVNLGIQLWLDLLAERVTGSRWLQIEWHANGLPEIAVRNAPATLCRVCRPIEPAHARPA